MAKMDDGSGNTPSIQVLERMFALMNMLAEKEGLSSLKEISEKTQLHPSTAHRILNDLVIGRFVDRPEPGSYRLGMRLLELGNMVKARLNVRDAALAPMRELHKLIQQPVNLSMRQGDEIVYVERAYSERSGMQVVRAIGGRAPLHLTSVGKLFLSIDDPLKVRSYATRTGLSGHTRNSITQLPVLERELSKVRQYGIARDNEELEMGVRCIAAGIRDDSGELVVNGETGEIVPSEDVESMAIGIVRMAMDPARSAAHGRAGRALIERQFGMSSMVSAYQALYDGLLAGRTTQVEKC